MQPMGDWVCRTKRSYVPWMQLVVVYLYNWVIIFSICSRVEWSCDFNKIWQLVIFVSFFFFFGLTSSQRNLGYIYQREVTLPL